MHMGLATILKKMLVGRAFSTERGRIKLFGRSDWAMQPAVSLAYMLQEVGKKNGEEFLFELGYESGKLGAQELMKVTGIKLKGDKMAQKMVTELLEFIGEGRMEIVRLKSEKQGHHNVIIHVTDNPATEHAFRMYGHKSLVCAFFRGVYSAHAENEFGLKNVKFKEIRCLCKGSLYCEWQSKC
jgi:predicted hydrocarbon binding protein